jgi:6,7-dimethyl-8-ribityllumazine synthase
MDEIEVNLDGRGMSIGIVQSRFNLDVCEALLASCHTELVRLGVAEDDITLATVPGALEIPVALQRMADSEMYDALIALGAVIRGDTYHFEVVSNESARGVNYVQMECNIPVANAILTTDTDDQALARVTVKGTEAAQAAIEMANLLRVLA